MIKINLVKKLFQAKAQKAVKMKNIKNNTLILEGFSQNGLYIWIQLIFTHYSMEQNWCSTLFFSKNVLLMCSKSCLRKRFWRPDCRPDKFKSFQKCVEAFEIIRSTKGCQIMFQKRDLLVKQVVENKVRIQEGIVLKSVSNLVLIADSESTQNYMKIRQKIIGFRSFCVELWPKKVLHRISVPMSYI